MMRHSSWREVDTSIARAMKLAVAGPMAPSMLINPTVAACTPSAAPRISAIVTTGIQCLITSSLHSKLSKRPIAANHFSLFPDLRHGAEDVLLAPLQQPSQRTQRQRVE